jgi:periplasmic copper chaperone A
MKHGQAPASRVLLAALMLAAPFGAAAAETSVATVTFKTAWMRPVAAGMPDAQVYVDITSTVDLLLVGGTSPVASKVELVEVKMKNEQPDAIVVTSMPVPAGRTTRLAYRGSHLRLVGINRDLANGNTVPVTLAFKSADGTDIAASFDAQVRGLLLPRQMPAPIKPVAPDPSQDALPARAR